MTDRATHRAAMRTALSGRQDGLDELSKKLAAEFKSAPGRFDPASVVTLGRDGLRAFLAEVGADPDDVVGHPPVPVVSKPPPESDEGWTSHPSLDWHPYIGAISVGAVAGATVIAITAAAIFIFHL